MTFKVLDGVVMRDRDVHQSLLNGCLLRNCTFVKVRFSRCDLEQIQIQNCTFNQVNFENVEMTSARVDKSKFENCSFNDALIEDCIWRNTALMGSTFQKAVLHSTQFEDCQFCGNNLIGASVQRDTFRRAKFQKMTLGDCTFLNHLMVDCSFENVEINAESIGSIFGISAHDLLSLGLVYLGQKVIAVDSGQSLLDSLEEEYTRRHWLFMREMLRLNFKRVPTVVAIEACFEALLWPASSGAPLKSGDIEFLEMVVLELYRNNELPGISVLAFPERVKEFNLQMTTTELGQNLQLQRLVNRLRELLFKMIEVLGHSLAYVHPSDEAVRVHFVFEKKPDFDLRVFMNQSSASSGLISSRPTKLLREAPGSWSVFMESSITTLAALQVALWLLNGCAAQIIELKARLNVVSRRRLPKKIRDRVLLPNQQVPRWIAIAVQNLFSKLVSDPGHLERLARGLSAQNLQRVEFQPKQRH